MALAWSSMATRKSLCKNIPPALRPVYACVKNNATHGKKKAKIVPGSTFRR
jgi:hypothetical protein